MKTFIFSLAIIVCCISCGKQHKIDFPKDRDWGVVNINGDIIIPFAYDKLEAFSSSLFIAYRDTICVLVDTSGQVLTPLKYSKITPLLVRFFPPDSISEAERDSVISVVGTDNIPHDKLMAFANKKAGIINIRGEEVIPCIYDRIHRLCWDKNFVVESNKKFGVIDSVGKEIIPFVYDFIVNSYHSDFFIASKDGSYGLIDSVGNVCLPFDYRFIELSFHSEYLIAQKKEGLYGIISSEGKEIIPFEYSSLSIDKEGIIVQKNRKYSLIDFDNRVIIPFPQKGTLLTANIDSLSGNSYFFEVEKNEKFGVIDKNGKTIIPAKYDFILEEYDNPGHFRVSLNEKDGIVDKNGKIIIPVIYDGIGGWNSGVAIVCINEKNGVINDKGKIVVPFIYDCLRSLYDFNPVVYEAWVGEKVGIVNSKGEVILPIEFEGIYRTYHDNVVMLKQDGKWGIMNYTDKSIIVPFEYDDIDFMDFRRGWLAASKGGKREIMNNEGKIIFSQGYSDVNMHPYDSQFFIVKK